MPATELSTATPPPVVAVRLPCGTLRVTVMLPVTASASAMLKPAKLRLLSSPVEKLVGKVLVGATLMWVTVMVSVLLEVSPAVSRMVYVMVLTLPL